MYSKFTKIKNLSDRRRLPLLGKIRLGIKVKNSKGLNKQGLNPKCKHKPDETCIYCTHAKETSYFVCPDEVIQAFGSEPIELEIMFPMEDEGAIFPQSLRCYGMTRGLKCEGDGERATELIDGEMKDRDCPCEKLDKKECAKRAFLRVIIPKVSWGGVYQITTGSLNSIIDVNSGIDYVRALVGRVVMIPLTLKRIPIETHHDQKKQIHYTLALEFKGNEEFINQLRTSTKKILLEQERIALPAPQEDSVAGDEPADIIEANGIKDEEKQETPENKPETPQNTVEGKDTQAGQDKATQGKDTGDDKADIINLSDYRGLDLNHCQVQLIVTEIKNLLEKAGYLMGKNEKGLNYQTMLIQSVNKSGKKWRDVGRPGLLKIISELYKSKGDPRSICTPF